MAFKLIVLAAFVASAQAGLIGVPHGQLALPVPLAYGSSYGSIPVAQAVISRAADDEYDSHPQYSFNYDVQDPSTGDSKSQTEIRDGDVVKGSYSVLEADGTRRTVSYVADDVNGFNAVVEKEPAAVAFKTVHAAPVVYSAPVVQPVVKSVVQAAIVPAETTISKYSTGFTHHAPVVHSVAEYSAPVYAHVSAPIAAGW